MKKYPVIWPGYETVSRLGRGGYGTVWKVCKTDASGEYYSAVKKISIPSGEEDYATLEESGYTDQEITSIFRSRLDRIEEEFKLMEQFQGHSNIVSYQEHMEVEHEDGPGWDILIRMELLTPLSKCYERFSEREVIRLGTHICTALETIERRNIVHRDIKPSNILYSEKLGYYKLSDFGIAKTMDHVTKGTMIGTADYIAPEVFHREAYGFQADQYSLGLVLYWMLNKRKLPFVPSDHIPTDDEMQDAKLKRISGEPLPPPFYGSDALKAVVLKAASYEPSDRYPDIRALHRALEDCEEEADRTLFTGLEQKAGGKEEREQSKVNISNTNKPPVDLILDFDDDDESIGRFDRFDKKKDNDQDFHDKTASPGPSEGASDSQDISGNREEEAEDSCTIGSFGKQKKSGSHGNASSGTPGNEQKTKNEILTLLDLAERYFSQGGEGAADTARMYEAQAEEIARKDLFWAFYIQNLYAVGYRDESHILPKNQKKSVQWMKFGAEAGDPDCMYTLANAFMSGSSGIPKDLEKAKEWADRALHKKPEDPGYIELKKKIEIQSAAEKIDFNTLFKDVFQVSFSASVQKVLTEYLPQISYDTAGNSRYTIAPDLDLSFLESIYKSWSPDGKDGERIREDIRSRNLQVLGVFQSGFHPLMYPNGLRLIFTDQVVYFNSPGIFLPWYSSDPSGKGQKNNIYGLFYNRISSAEIMNHMVFGVTRKLHFTLKPAADGYVAFDVPFEKKYLQEDRLLEMFTKLKV